MPGLQHSVTISAPPELVWAIVVDVDDWPRRIPTVDSLERLDPGPLAVGSRVRLRQPRLPEAVWTVTGLDEGRSFTWVSTSPGVEVTASHLVEADPSGSRLTLDLSLTGRIAPLGWLMTKRLSQRYVATEAASIKSAAEGG